jgi:hypothetical protein
MVRVIMLNATFIYISVISWRSVLLVEETGMPGENHRPVSSHWQALSVTCDRSVANRTNFFILSKSCRTDDLSHFSYRTCAFCKAHSDWLQLPLAALHINRHRVTSKIRLTMPRVEMSRADRNPWLVKIAKQLLRKHL